MWQEITIRTNRFHQFNEILNELSLYIGNNTPSSFGLTFNGSDTYILYLSNNLSAESSASIENFLRSLVA